MKKAFVLANSKKEKVCRILDEALPMLKRAFNVQMVDLYEFTGEVDGGADLAIVFGGDGSILSAARALGAHQIPTIGVNIGKFGFLAEVEPHHLEEVVNRLVEGSFDIMPRMMLHCRAERNGQILRESLALNDVVISRGALSRMISVGLFIDDEDVTDYNGDGLIISTPVGSTAHSLAAGGPILQSNMAAMVITPISPHTLSNRPLVIPADARVSMVINPMHLPVALTIDGQIFTELQPEDKISVRKAEQNFLLIEARTRTYYETLRNKLGWGGHPNYGRS